MKLLSFKIQEEPHIGILLDNRVFDLNSAFNYHLGGAYADSIHRFELDMLSFLELGKMGIAMAYKAVETAKTLEGDYYQGGRIFFPLDRLKIISPIPRPRKNIVCPLFLS